jgi:hypothetical protein
MPTSYKIDKRRKVVMCAFSGVVSRDDVLATREQLLQDPDFDPNYSQLLDLTGATQLDFKGNHVRFLADMSPHSLGSRRAIVAGSELEFGFARMFEIVRTLRGDQHIRVFRNRASALAWLIAKSKAA